MKRKVSVNSIKDIIKKLCIKANLELPDDIMNAFKRYADREELTLAKNILQILIQNANLACEKKIPICQDTGMAVIFVEVGQEVSFIDGDLYTAINAGVAEGYTEGYLRKSVVEDPLKRKNTGDNTPAVIYTDIVKGDKVKITVMPKGFGSENMSRIKMLTPTAGPEGVKDFVVNTVRTAGGNPCPPVIVGVGLGGTFEKAALLAKKSLLRSLGQPNPLSHIAELEQDILLTVNRTNVGPQGLGGMTTAIAVHIETYPTHIAGLPVAVNICCHAARHATEVL